MLDHAAGRQPWVSGLATSRCPRAAVRRHAAPGRGRFRTAAICAWVPLVKNFHVPVAHRGAAERVQASRTGGRLDECGNSTAKAAEVEDALRPLIDAGTVTGVRAGHVTAKVLTDTQPAKRVAPLWRNSRETVEVARDHPGDDLPECPGACALYSYDLRLAFNTKYRPDGGFADGRKRLR